MSIAVPLPLAACGVESVRCWIRSCACARSLRARALQAGACAKHARQQLPWQSMRASNYPAPRGPWTELRPEGARGSWRRRRCLSPCKAEPRHTRGPRAHYLGDCTGGVVSARVGLWAPSAQICWQGTASWTDGASLRERPAGLRMSASAKRTLAVGEACDRTQAQGRRGGLAAPPARRESRGCGGRCVGEGFVVMILDSI